MTNYAWEQATTALQIYSCLGYVVLKVLPVFFIDIALFGGLALFCFGLFNPRSVGALISSLLRSLPGLTASYTSNLVAEATGPPQQSFHHAPYDETDAKNSNDHATYGASHGYAPAGGMTRPPTPADTVVLPLFTMVIGALVFNRWGA